MNHDDKVDDYSMLWPHNTYIPYGFPYNRFQRIVNICHSCLGFVELDFFLFYFSFLLITSLISFLSFIFILNLHLSLNIAFNI